MSDISDTETVGGMSDITDISETFTLVETEPQSLHPQLEDLYNLSAPSEPYLTQKRYKEFEEYKRDNPRQYALLPPPFSIEFSFNDFTSALSRAFLAAQQKPASLTAPGSCEEFRSLSEQMGIKISLSVPPIQTQSEGNVLEVKRMVFASVLRWAEVWEGALPDGVDKRLLYKDLVKFITEKANARKKEDCIRIRLGQDIFAYKDADWREIMEQDLHECKWKGWRYGAL
ncbi:hypothetical protein AAF712_015756 [Marasmius tenuissimus]|uniref:Uncharacterized protein n=1 Tax=Marasmius tenuissimus TaxID=585030 RepID=A0ABR2Z8I0_9AGAR